MIITNEQFKALNQTNRNINVKIKLLDMLENEIDEVSGICLGGDINLSSDNPIRSNGNIELVIDDKSFLPTDETKKIWLNRKAKINLYINEIKEPFDYGTFILDAPKISHNVSNKNISLQLKDKMCFLDGTISGQLQNRITIESRMPIKEVVRLLVEISGEKKISIMDTKDDLGVELVLPYSLDKEPTDTISNVLDEIKELFLGYEYFYDNDGRFVWQRIKDRKDDAVIWTFNEENKDNFAIAFAHEPNWQNIKNEIQIWGKTKDDGNQVQHLLKNQNQGQFCIDKIGKRTLTHKDEKIFSNEQAKLQAEYYQFKHSHLDEKITIECVPVYGLAVNNIIYVKDSNSGIDGRYRVDDVAFGLSHDSTMSITAKKLYYESK